MKAFVSGQLKERTSVRAVYDKLQEIGIKITHDWTRTEDLSSYSRHAREAARRADMDVRGVLEADIYILLTDNQVCGKGMYVELGAAIARCATTGAPHIFLVGQMKHESIFYHHPSVQRFGDIDSCIAHIGKRWHSFSLCAERGDEEKFKKSHSSQPSSDS